MSIQPVRFPVRDKVRQRARSSVFSEVRRYSTRDGLPNKWPSATYRATLLPTWQSRMLFTTQASKARISTWIPEWYKFWTKSAREPTTPAPAPSKGSDSNSSGRKKLSRKQIKSLIDEHGIHQLLVHGTRSLNVAKGEVPLQAETDQSKMSNPMQRVSVFAYVGIESSKDYGPYGVLIKAAGGWGPAREDGARLFKGTEVPEDQILGYFEYDEYFKKVDDLD